MVRSKKGKDSEAWKGLAEGDFSLGLGVVQAQKSPLGAIHPAGLAVKEWAFARAQILPYLNLVSHRHITKRGTTRGSCCNTL